jgi:hypothetical protein
MEDMLKKYNYGGDTNEAALDEVEQVFESDQNEIEYVFESDQDGVEPALETDQDETELVLKALSNPKYQWRTVAGIAKETGLDPDIVTDVLGRLKDRMVRSTRSTKDGQEVFATRERFRQFASPWTKILGALKNRAD